MVCLQGDCCGSMHIGQILENWGQCLIFASKGDTLQKVRTALPVAVNWRVPGDARHTPLSRFLFCNLRFSPFGQIIPSFLCYSNDKTLRTAVQSAVCSWDVFLRCIRHNDRTQAYQWLHAAGLSSMANGNSFASSRSRYTSGLSRLSSVYSLFEKP